MPNKPRKLRPLERLSLKARRRMGLEIDDEKLDAKIVEKVNQAIADLQTIGKLPERERGVLMVSISSGLRSSPSPGAKKVVNLFVTSDGKLEVFFEEE